MANGQKKLEATPTGGDTKANEPAIKQGAELQKSLTRFVRFPTMPAGSINGETIDDDHVTANPVGDEFVKSLEAQFAGITHEDVSEKEMEGILAAREERKKKLGY